MGLSCFDTSLTEPFKAYLTKVLSRTQTQFYLWYVAGVVMFNWWSDTVEGNEQAHHDHRSALVSYPANVCSFEWFSLGENEFETAVVTNSGMLC